MDKNLNTYNIGDVVQWYVRLDKLVDVEISVFDKYREKIAAGDLLDIGIGGGRTTRCLINMCKKYIGLDYSLNFVNSVRKQFPNEDIRLMDARDLSSFGNNSFDFVNFSFNGLDYVDLEGRTRVLNEVYRVLKPDGVFFFSTHNKSHPTFNKFPWLYKTNTLLTNIKTAIKLLPYIPKHYLRKIEETINTDFAIINDSAHNFNLMTFYTTPEFLVRQLSKSHFTDIELMLKNGNTTIDNHYDDWIFVVSKKLTS